ncbi:MAG: phytoene desaturase family protein [Nitrososphaerales archaeon]
MPAKTLIVIGAGLAGLAAGVHAQRNGYQTQIFEHGSQPGGVAVGWRRGEYFIDGGIHFLMGHRPGQPVHSIYEEVGTAGPEMCVDMDDYGLFVDERSGRQLAVTADLDRLLADWRSLSPEDAPVMAELIHVARQLAGSDALNLGMGDPPELAGRFAGLGLLWQMRSVLRYFAGPTAQTMGERGRAIRDPWLRQVYENLFFPQAPVWFVAMVLALLSSRAMGLLKGGSTSFVRPIERCFRDLGGEVAYNATVEKILAEDGRAVGVRLYDGREHRAGAVISAADGHSTLFEMLGEPYVDAALRERFEKWALIPPMVMLSFGVDREFAGEPHIHAYFLDRPFAVGPREVGALLLRTFNYSPVFAPRGKTVVQATFDSDWDYWCELRRDQLAYEAEKRRVAGEVLEQLERHYPGLTGQVEVTDVATPCTTWRYTRNYRGAYEGWLPTPKQLMTALPRTLKGLDRFVMAGQWIMPGGGVPTCIASGRDAVRILCAKDGVAFRPR